MNILAKWWRFVSRPWIPVKEASRIEKTNIDFETDSLRFTYESLLMEYDAVRQEILFHLQMEERSLSYLLVLIGGVVSALQFFQEQSIHLASTLNSNPVIYLALALISLLFPLTLLEHALFLADLGVYIHNVLSPKIRIIATHLSTQSDATKEFITWESEQFPSYLTGMFRWEGYRLKAQYRTASPVFGLLAIFKYVFVCIPAALFTVAFISAKAAYFAGIAWTSVEILLFVVFMSFVLTLLVGMLMAVGTYATMK